MVELPGDGAHALAHPGAHVDPPGGAPELFVVAPEGPHVLGPATVDSDADGRADTAVALVPGGIELGTDLDGDAHVDVLTRVHGDGTATTTELSGGRHPDPALPPWDEGPPPPAPTIDPVTGRWVRDG